MAKKKKKRRKPNLKKPNSLTWRNKADKAWKKQILSTGYCEKCKSDNVASEDKQCHSHHIISRTRLRFRHDLSNGVCLCAWHHNFDPMFAPHADSFSNEKFLEWLEEARPGQFQWYEENKHDKRMSEKTYQQCYEDLISMPEGGTSQC